MPKSSGNGEDKVISIEYPSPFLKNCPAEVIVKKQENDTFSEDVLETRRIK